MGLSTINSQYVGLNGLSGYGGYGIGATGLYSDAYVENAKTNIANGYELSATSNSYSNKGAVSSSSFAQQSQAIAYLLQEGRTDDAMAKYETLYKDMASNSYYSGYTENEIKTLLQDKYLDATGTTIVNDIDSHSSSSYATGALSSLAGIGLMFNANSKDDFISEATGTTKSKASTVEKALGVATGVGISGGLAAAGVAIKGALSGKGSTKKAKIVAAVAAGGAALLTYFGGKIAKKSN